MSIWTREVKGIDAFPVHDIVSGMYLGLLHKIKNVCKHAKETVYLWFQGNTEYSVGKKNMENASAASAASVCGIIQKNHFSCN